MKTASTEREAIVAYLRERADKAVILNPHYHLHRAAAAISRGDHLKDQDHGRA